MLCELLCETGNFGRIFEIGVDSRKKSLGRVESAGRKSLFCKVHSVLASRFNRRRILTAWIRVSLVCTLRRRLMGIGPRFSQGHPEILGKSWRIKSLHLVTLRCSRSAYIQWLEAVIRVLATSLSRDRLQPQGLCYRELPRITALGR